MKRLTSVLIAVLATSGAVALPKVGVPHRGWLFNDASRGLWLSTRVETPLVKSVGIGRAGQTSPWAWWATDQATVVVLPAERGYWRVSVQIVPGDERLRLWIRDATGVTGVDEVDATCIERVCGRAPWLTCDGTDCPVSILPPGLPEPPVITDAISPQSSRWVLLRFRPKDFGDEREFSIERSSNGFTWVEIARVPWNAASYGGVLEYRDVPDENNKTYSYRVKAVSIHGSGRASAVMTAMTGTPPAGETAPAAPTGLTATAVP